MGYTGTNFFHMQKNHSIRAKSSWAEIELTTLEFLAKTELRKFALKKDDLNGCRTRVSRALATRFNRLRHCDSQWLLTILIIMIVQLSAWHLIGFNIKSWSNSLKVGCVPQRHFQQFSLMTKRMSNYQGKKDKSSGLKVVLLWLGNFHTYIRKKDVRTILVDLILSSENWMYFTENVISSSKYFDLDWVFISNTGNDGGQGIPQCPSRPGSSLQQPQPRFQTKTTSWFYFRNTVLSSRNEKLSCLVMIWSKSKYKAWYLSQCDVMKYKIVITFICGGHSKQEKSLIFLHKHSRLCAKFHVRTKV